MYVISNKGEIELAALFLLGASSKEGQEGKIGFFGSGNKYALATLIRKGIGFRIFSGKREIKIETKEIDFRGETFKQIVIDDQPTSFTSRMGPTWETWYALRELVCNAIDEGDTVFKKVDSDASWTPFEGMTTVFIDDHLEVCDFFDNINTYILQTEPLHKNVDLSIDIHRNEDKEGAFALYRRGVRCSPTMTNQKSLFHYNAKIIDINESRIAMYDFQVRNIVKHALGECKDVSIIAQYLANRRNTKLFENQITDWEHIKFSEAWGTALKGINVFSKSRAEHVPNEDTQGENTIVLPDEMVNVFDKQFPEMMIEGRGEHMFYTVEPTAVQRTQVEKAYGEAVQLGFIPNPIPYKIVKFFDLSTMACYRASDNTMFLSVDYLSDYDELVRNIAEEGFHNQGYFDGSREFEQHLMRLLLEERRKKKPESVANKSSHDTLKKIAALEEFSGAMQRFFEAMGEDE